MIRKVDFGEKCIAYHFMAWRFVVSLRIAGVVQLCRRCCQGLEKTGWLFTGARGNYPTDQNRLEEITGLFRILQ
jgi:hypothetical protein